MTSYHVHMHHFLGVTGRMLLCIFDSRICKARSVLTPCGTTQYVTIRYDTYRIFLIYIPVNSAFNLPHYVTRYMHHTGKKRDLKKRKKNEVTKIFSSRDFEPGPSESVRTKS